MRTRVASILAVLLPAASALAMQQGTPPTPKVVTPSGWPVIGYAIAGILFVAAVTLSLKSTVRTELDDTGGTP
jgi:hypothetical protein